VSRYRTVFAPEARDELRKISREVALRILAKLTELEADPYGLKTTALVSQPDRRRLRVGDYRVIYTVEAEDLVVWVVHVGHRSRVYDS
jgi:mRNA interferase RelE/StbE